MTDELKDLMAQNPDDVFTKALLEKEKLNDADQRKKKVVFFLTILALASIWLCGFLLSQEYVANVNLGIFITSAIVGLIYASIALINDGSDLFGTIALALFIIATNYYLCSSFLLH